MSSATSGSRKPGDPESSPPAATPQGMPVAFRIALALVLLVLALFALRQIGSPDIGFHLKAGNHVLSGEGWPSSDPFTYTLSDRPYVDTTWGYQVVIALVERTAGAAGLILLHSALVLGIFTLAVLAARLVPGETRVLLLLLLLGGLAAEPRFEVRPEILSYALLACVLYLLHRHAERLGSRLWLLPPIFLVWTNAHGLFVLGWIALGCFVAGLWIRWRRPDLPLLAWSAASVVVGLVNPYGWKALAFPLTLATRMFEHNPFARTIGEFRSPFHYLLSDQLTFYLVSTSCFFLFALLALGSVRSLVRQRRYWCVLLCLAFLPLSLAMVRNVPPFVVACLPGTVWGLSLDRMLDAVGLRGRLRRGLRHAFLGALLFVTAAVGLRICTDAYYVSSRRLDRFGLAWNRLALPLDAAAWARQARPPGRMLNHLNFGGWLMWAQPDPVFIDGRLEVTGERFFEEYRRALGSPAELEAAVRRHGIGWIVFPYRLRPDLLAGLSRHPSWRLVYVDSLAVVFVREDLGAAALVHESARRAVRPPDGPADLDALPGLGGADRAGSGSGWLAGPFRRRSYPFASFNRGIFHFHRREPVRAATAFAEAVRRSEGAYYEIYGNLGAALLATDRLEPARECYRIYLRELPFYRVGPRRRARARLDEIDRRLGD